MTRTMVIIVGLSVIFAIRMSICVVDPDLWHEMSLGREIVRLGHVPMQDTFAYTPTVNPVVHHEWGAGFLAYAIAMIFGPAGIVALKYLLASSLAVLGWRCARQGGASIELISLLAPFALLMADLGFSTVRAQMYSYVGAAALLMVMDLDRMRRRHWIPVWLVIWVLWLNLHAGFLVGAGWFALYWLEQAFRRQAHWHLFATGIAMAGLIILNPFGYAYYRYLWQATTLDRPYVAEWASVWQVASVHQQIVFVASILLLTYAVSVRRLRGCDGLAIILVTAYVSVSHARLLPFFAIAWFCYLPRYLKGTAIAVAVKNIWDRWDRLLRGALAIACCLLLLRVATMEPLRLLVPNQPLRQLGDPIAYPVGVAIYLQDVGFRGNVMVHFNHGSFVMWTLYPRVRVSMDGRYEVAYPPSLAERIHALYTTGENWESILREYPTDAVLVPEWSVLNQILLEHGQDASTTHANGAWRRVYVDDEFSLYVRHDLPRTLPILDRRGEAIRGSLP